MRCSQAHHGLVTGCGLHGVIEIGPMWVNLVRRVDRRGTMKIPAPGGQSRRIGRFPAGRQRQ